MSIKRKKIQKPDYKLPLKGEKSFAKRFSLPFIISSITSIPLGATKNLETDL